jgi:hypothetical protein
MPRRDKAIVHADLTWHQMPQDGGQIIDRRYAIDVDQDVLILRELDQSDNSVSYTAWKLRNNAGIMDLRFEPWNGVLPAVCKHTAKVVVQV